MKRIFLRCGTPVLVDDCDFPWLSEWEWHFNGGYAAQGQRRKVDGYYKKTLMHRVIALCMGLELQDGQEVDHINRNRLDNRRRNLRVVSKSLNKHNCKVRSDSSTGITGIHVSPQGQYVARIQINGERRYLGRFDLLADAIEARKQAEKKGRQWD